MTEQPDTAAIRAEHEQDGCPELRCRICDVCDALDAARAERDEIHYCYEWVLRAEAGEAARDLAIHNGTAAQLRAEAAEARIAAALAICDDGDDVECYLLIRDIRRALDEDTP